MASKPLTRKAYGSIPHLPESRLGPSDKQANPGHSRIATVKTRDQHDFVVVTEKLDGSCVAAAKIHNTIVPLTRSGYHVKDSPYDQHKYWGLWVYENLLRFDSLLDNGDWAVGEWCIQAHATRYTFTSEPFFLFDIFHQGKRLTCDWVSIRQNRIPFPHDRFVQPHVLACGHRAVSVDEALDQLGTNGWHMALDQAEGAVWRVERNGQVDFLCKYVRPDKQDGIYLPETSNSVRTEPLWNYWLTNSPSIQHLKNPSLLTERS